MTFTNSDITGAFPSTTAIASYLLQYPYMYIMTQGTSPQLYRLNVISHQSELLASINISSAFTTVNTKSVTDRVCCTGTDRLYCIIAGKESSSSTYGNNYYLCSVNLTNYNVSRVYSSAIYGNLASWSGTSANLGYFHITQVDADLIDMTMYAYERHGIAGGSSAHYYYYLWRFNVTTSTRTATTVTQSKSFSSTSETSYIYPTAIPRITRASDHYQLVYGGRTLANTYITKAGYTMFGKPTSIDTLDSSTYIYAEIFELNGQYYTAGGYKDGNPNTDIIRIDKNSFASTKVGTSTNPTSANALIGVTETAAYIIYPSTTTPRMTTAALEEYNIQYEFKDNAGNVLASIDNRLPATKITLGISGLDATVAITYIDNTTETVVFSVPSKPDYRFYGLSTAPNSSRASIVVGENTVGIYQDITFYPVYIKYVVPTTTFDINLYQNSAEPNRVDKSSFLTSVATLSGALREECSIVNPSIMIEQTTLPSFNYVYISIFNRYYFVTGITSVRYGLWRIELKVDPLMSWKTGIGGLSAVIGRQEFSYNADLVDSELPVEKEQTVEITEIANSTFSTATTGTGVHNYMLVVVGA